MEPTRTDRKIELLPFDHFHCHAQGRSNCEGDVYVIQRNTIIVFQIKGTDVERARARKRSVEEQALEFERQLLDCFKRSVYFEGDLVTVLGVRCSTRLSSFSNLVQHLCQQLPFLQCAISRIKCADNLALLGLLNDNNTAD